VDHCAINWVAHWHSIGSFLFVLSLIRRTHLRYLNSEDLLASFLVPFATMFAVVPAYPGCYIYGLICTIFEWFLYYYYIYVVVCDL
jgi:hypothetical protein